MMMCCDEAGRQVMREEGRGKREKWQSLFLAG